MIMTLVIPILIFIFIILISKYLAQNTDNTNFYKSNVE